MLNLSPAVWPIGSPPSTNSGIAPATTLKVSSLSRPKTSNDSLLVQVTVPSMLALLPSSTVTLPAGMLMLKVCDNAFPTTTRVSSPPLKFTATALPPVFR